MSKQQSDVLCLTPQGFLRSWFVVNGWPVPAGLTVVSEPAEELTETAALNINLTYNPPEDNTCDIIVYPENNAVLTLIWNVKDKALLKKDNTLSAKIQVVSDNPNTRVVAAPGEIMFYKLYTEHVHTMSLFNADKDISGMLLTKWDNPDKEATKSEVSFTLDTFVPRGVGLETLYLPQAVRKLI